MDSLISYPFYLLILLIYEIVGRQYFRLQLKTFFRRFPRGNGKEKFFAFSGKETAGIFWGAAGYIWIMVFYCPDTASGSVHGSPKRVNGG
ncbi:hypothetical protein HMPREF1631_04555 [Arcanobacterium sp. S3PF19]|nr:hypothetical protein HMPREF1631_04555 [Arcanobacterium sp. S3PF19]